MVIGIIGRETLQTLSVASTCGLAYSVALSLITRSETFFLGDTVDHIQHLLLELAQFLVAAQVEILTELIAGPFQFPSLIADVALQITALGCRSSPPHPWIVSPPIDATILRLDQPFAVARILSSRLLADSACGALLRILAMLTKPIFKSAAWTNERGSARAVAANNLYIGFTR